MRPFMRKVKVAATQMSCTKNERDNIEKALKMMRRKVIKTKLLHTLRGKRYHEKKCAVYPRNELTKDAAAIGTTTMGDRMTARCRCVDELK